MSIRPYMEGPILKTKLGQTVFTQLKVKAKGQEYYLIAYCLF